MMYWVLCNADVKYTQRMTDGKNAISLSFIGEPYIWVFIQELQLLIDSSIGYF